MSEKSIKFQTEMTRTGGTTTGVVLPPDLFAQLGAGARPAVVARINDYTYRTTVGTMKGQAMLPFSAQHREASGISGGDQITVELSLDTEPRTIEVPDDLAQALAAEPALEGAFQALAPSRRKADIESVNGAKADATRARRIEAIIVRLRG